MSVGPQFGCDGVTLDTRQGKSGEVITGTAHGKYYEAAGRGAIAFASDGGLGIATNTALGTTAIFSLYNSPFSGRRLVINRVSIAYFSGTLGAGPLYHCLTPQVSGTAQTLPSGGTALTAYWTSINNLSPYNAPVGLARTASTVVQGIVVRPIGAIMTGVGFTGINDDCDGEFVLDPGGCYQIQSVCAAGTSPKVTVGCLWEELFIVAPQG